MTTLTLTLDLADPSGIELAIRNLSLLVGKGPAASPAAGQRTAPAGGAPAPTGAAKAPTAASAGGQSQASTAATGEAGNAATGAGQAAGASAASSQKDAVELTFDVVKKAVLDLGGRKNGRDRVMAIYKPFGIEKLPEAKPEQYAAIKAAVDAEIAKG
jgi:hypothetical protein